LSASISVIGRVHFN